MDEIGQKLRTARIEKGYTLDDLQQITKIQKRYLIAIEEGNFDALPGDFYVRAFIKQYAETVGLDADALLTQFQQDIPDTQPQEYVEQSVENRTRSERSAENSPVNKLRQHAWPIAIAALAIVIIVGVYLVMWHNSSSQPKETIPTNDNVSVSSSKKTSSRKKTSSSSQKASSSSSSSKNAASSSKKTKKSSKKHSGLKIAVTDVSTTRQTATVTNLPATGNKLKVAATDAAAWVAVYVNNAVTWQGTVQPGSEHTVDLPDGTTNFAVNSGNMPKTTISLNSKKVDLGTTTTSVVRTVTFSAAAASSSESGNAQ
ncbi:helix-turn-helix domain-containing protein [Lacticaseibacillus camelliae]|uniref:XRE family transcriptional regulator n=1 Tax=Lacticaseibacillus camelliae DSM 22697 = JCM 13995 TaxID=1423730 RepID=A0A0R2F7T9_9LACO|nr:RodZ domain-containing protein [Lacticaseibacillus camelliae]KRN20740.1 XRE family transcriptional regulator [Lacticaseibacillus camelliae DSM 22697 = JCM 13995]